jgi:hypothetical protein
MKKRDLRQLMSRILFVTLLGSIGYTIVRIIQTPVTLVSEYEYIKVRSDYVLMLIQCLLGLIVMTLPSFINRKFSIQIPSFVEILFYVFLYCAIYLGEVRSFYYLIPFWDTILHAFSGAMLGALGFSLVSMLNREVSNYVKLSPFFIALFAFSFALAFGSIWEIYEFVMDQIFNTNMQKFITYEGVTLIGKAALRDTMKDIIVDTISALLVSLVGYLSIIKQKESN